MAVAILDTDYLSAYLSLPQQTLTTVLDQPTSELVRSVLEAVTAKAREHDELAADKLHVDIELESAVRSSETRIEGLRSSLEKSQKDLEEDRKKLSQEENSRAALESELQKLKSSSTTSFSEVETLRARIASLESANRDSIALLETKTNANASLLEDIQKQHQKILELNQQITALQQTVQNANSSLSSAKFREQSLKQELELARRNNEWFENELKTKNAESLKLRKEKGARIAELQRMNEEASSNVEALKKTEQALRARLDEVQKKAEDSFLKVQQLQEASAKSEEGFRQELESGRRLADLQTQQAKAHWERLQEVDSCQQEVEAERELQEQAERRIAELEAEVDRLEALTQAQPVGGSIPATPRQGLNGSMLGRAGSPSGPFSTPGSIRGKSAITATQAIEELYKVKGQLANEKRRSERLAADMEEMLQDLEAKQPEIEELQAEHERLQQEVVQMSSFVDQAGIERDRAKKDARRAESEASTAQAEANILRQQLRDLSAQVKMLLCDMEARERGYDALSADERLQLERLARGEIGEEALEGLTDTDRFISERLVVFRSISELQEKNQELLKITRQLGAQMESEEALTAKHQAAKDHEEVQSLQAKIENYKDELRSMVTRSESYIKERDMFRRMLQYRGQIPAASEIGSMFDQSITGENDIITTTENNHHSTDAANYATLLREMQAQFDHYREEQTVDRRTLKEQAEKLSSEKGALQAEIARVSSQLTLANERYEMLHSNYVMLQKENNEMQKRSQTLSEAAAIQDLRTQQVAEDLIEAKSLVESMRNENANLKAEKTLWKDIQDRLTQDNENLMNERSRLNGLVASQQTLQNEHELAESENRRRVQSQLESLEAELSTTKRKLADEVEDHKKTQLRKEYDNQQSQKRIDDLVTNLGQVREELVAAKTNRDNLQARVDELTIELKSAEERVEVLRPQPTPRPGANVENISGNDEPVQDNILSREQTLAIEVSELKRDLDLAKSELENTKGQMEQYKAISQSSEEELQSLNATQDQYREEMDRIIEEKNTQIRNLQQRIDDLSAELTNTNNEMTTLRNQQSEVTRQTEEQKAALEAEIMRLKDEDERHATAAQFHQQDLRAQAAIATKAQQDYENELVKHAEAAKLLQNLRSDYNQLKTEAASLRVEAESARVTLSQSAASWEERKMRLEQEIKELKARRDDANAQNKLLHQQLENLGSQISGLQQSRSSGSDHPEVESPPATPNRTVDGLRELNSFLRREKEIVEVQYDLQMQESKRLQQQLTYAQSQLDETRLKLEQERQGHDDSSRSSVAHKNLMEKLNELNLFRESSITLRNEARQAQAQVAEKTKQIEELIGQIQPLEATVRELELGKETMEGEMNLLKEDRDRWQKRTQDILSKYDRVDPAEMDQLKQTIEALKVERDSLLEEKQPLQEKIETLEGEKASWQQTRQKLTDQFKEKVRKDKADRTAEREAASAEKVALQEQLTSLKAQLETAIQERDSLQQCLAAIQQELDSTKLERDQALTSRPVGATDSSVAAAQVSQEPQTEDVLNNQLSDLRKELDLIRQKKQSLEDELSNLRQELEKVTSERDNALSIVAELRSKPVAPSTDVLMQHDEPNNHTEHIVNSALSDEERKSLEDRVAEAEAKVKEQEERAAKIEEQMEATLKARSDKMKTALNKKLAESRESAKAQLEAEYNLRLEQEKQIWLAENKPAIPPETPKGQPKETETAPSGTPSTPSQKTPGGTSFDVNSLSDADVRNLLSTNPTIKSILATNLKKKLEVETQKIKEEQEKRTADKLAEAQKKAENAKVQAVLMEGKKSALKLNMMDNKNKIAAAKLQVVETAATDTPDKPVAEVWEIAKSARPPPPPPVPVAAAVENQLNGTAEASPKLESKPESKPEPKPEATTTGISRPPSQQQQTSIPSTTNGTSNPPVSNIPTPSSLPVPGNAPRPSGIPHVSRGGGPNRGRGNLYQSGRGRGGGQQRGGLSAAAPNFNPQAPTGMKRPREDGTGGGPGNLGKRARGGGQNS
ncbi:hypothetical protein B7463_g7500, partial [Scytalidium lignicola]